MDHIDPMHLPQKLKVIGNYYHYGNHCEFLLGMYINGDDKKILDFRRMAGDGCTFDIFYRALKALLRSGDLAFQSLANIGEVDEDDDSFDDYSDDDDFEDPETSTEQQGQSDLGDLLKDGGFLQLKYDRKIV